MAVFRGNKNLVLGGDEPWAIASYDDSDRSFVVEVDGKDADRFRAVADEYGFAEVEADAKPRSKTKPKAATAADEK